MEMETDKKPLLENEKFNGTLILPNKKTCNESCVVKYVFCCFYKNYSLSDSEKITLNNLNKLLGSNYNNDKDGALLDFFHTNLLEEYNIEDTNDKQIWKTIGFQVNKNIIFVLTLNFI